MGILDNLEPPKRKTPCRIRTLLSEFDEADAAKLLTALADLETWPAYTLSKALSSLGVTVSADAISRHRTGVCSCLKN